MKRRSFVLATVVLVAFSALLFWKCGIEDYGPFDGCINFHSTTLIERQQLGYNGLPAYHADSRGHGYFDLYANSWSSNERTGICVYDEPFWPDGDPGLGAQNPLPPFVRRHTINAISPELPEAILGTAWCCWATVLIVSASRRPARGRGFEVGKAAA